MSASAKLFGKVDVDHAHFRAVFLSEKLLDVGAFLGLFVSEFVDGDGIVAAHFLVDEILDLAQLFAESAL